MEAHQLRANNNIISFKEESNTSHACKGYGQLVVKNDKLVAAENLYDQRKLAKFTTGKMHISQWYLVIIDMAIVRQTTPEMWTKSYRKVNLDPRTRLDLPSWCEKIKHLLSGDGVLKEEVVDLSAEGNFGLLTMF